MVLVFPSTRLRATGLAGSSAPSPPPGRAARAWSTEAFPFITLETVAGRHQHAQPHPRWSAVESAVQWPLCSNRSDAAAGSRLGSPGRGAIYRVALWWTFVKAFSSPVVRIASVSPVRARISRDFRQPGSVSAPARLVLVGVRGFGEVHAARIARLTDEGLVELVAAVDPGVTLDPPVIYGTDLYPDLDTALAAVGPVDVVVVAAPLGACTSWPCPHGRRRRLPGEASGDVAGRLQPAARPRAETGRVVQVGFQSLGSHALPMLQDDTFGIGRWFGSVPSGPGRGPWATGPAHRGRAAAACAAGR